MTEPADERQSDRMRTALRHSIALQVTGVLATAIAYLTLSPPTGDPPGFIPDKAAHLIAFAALAFPTALLYARCLIWVLPAALAFGGAIELVQPYVGRQAEFADFVADVVGVGIGTILGLVLRAKVLKRSPGLPANGQKLKTSR